MKPTVDGRTRLACEVPHCYRRMKADEGAGMREVEGRRGRTGGRETSSPARQVYLVPGILHLRIGFDIRGLFQGAPAAGSHPFRFKASFNKDTINPLTWQPLHLNSLIAAR